MMEKTKKQCILLSLLTILFFIPSCKDVTANKSSDYDPGTDFNIYLENYGRSTKMVETETGYYYISGDNFLYYLDKSSMQSIALCSKPNCSHTQIDYQICDAYTGPFAPSELYYYEGKLYGFLHHNEYGVTGKEDIFLCELAKDGTGFKELWQLDWDSNIQGYFNTGVFHRGNYYFYTTDGSNMAVYCYNLKKNKCSCIYQNEQIKGNMLQAIGDFLYWGYLEESIVDLVPFIESSTMRYQISTGEIVDFKGAWRVFAGDERIYFEYLDQEEQCRVLCYTNRDGTNFTETEFHLRGVGHADNSYIYGYPYQEGDTTVDVYDTETFDFVAELDISEQLERYNAFYVLPGTGEHIFLTNRARDILFYAKKSAIGTPDFQWYRVEKVN